ncbi:hypothetical protein HC358_00605 [Wolbachia pipientis]|uniref:Uncharacterized protein n=1 Tax=Wolbachia pipientis TaxID=955 RepID=A0A7G5C8X6_WOLPI|nr:hypothetical protein [Wolbachia pipientis]QMV45660.1 hypothetical protein HC358_00605 [Wolbachia pipientis]
MTGREGYWDDKEIGTGMTRKEHWNDIIGALGRNRHKVKLDCILSVKKKSYFRKFLQG